MQALYVIKVPQQLPHCFHSRGCVIKDDGEMIMSHEYIQNEEGGGGAWGPFEFTILALNCKVKITQ
jgi:hypothetical protein